MLGLETCTTCTTMFNVYRPGDEPKVLCTVGKHLPNGSHPSRDDNFSHKSQQHSLSMEPSPQAQVHLHYFEYPTHIQAFPHTRTFLSSSTFTESFSSDLVGHFYWEALLGYLPYSISTMILRGYRPSHRTRMLPW